MQKATDAKSAFVDLLIVAIGSVALVAAEPWARREGLIPGGEETSGLLAVVGLVVIAFLIILVRGPSFREIGFRRPTRWLMVPVWAFGILAVYMIALKFVPILLAPFFDVPSPDLTRYRSIYQNLPAAIGLAIALPFTASIPEEFIYRGFLMNRLSHIFGFGFLGAVATILVQGLIFGSIHYAWGLGGVVMTTIMGLIWGTAFVLCGRNLWIVMVAHSLVHIVFVAQLYFMDSITAG